MYIRTSKPYYRCLVCYIKQNKMKIVNNGLLYAEDYGNMLDVSKRII